MSGWLDTPNLRILEKGLDATALRNRVLANNIANVDTPGYKRSDVDFEAILGAELGQESDRLALKTSSPRHLPGLESGQGNAVVTDERGTMRNDGNNVDVDREMTRVAENTIQYNSTIRALSSQLAILRMVVQSRS